MPKQSVVIRCKAAYLLGQIGCETKASTREGSVVVSDEPVLAADFATDSHYLRRYQATPYRTVLQLHAARG